MEGKLNEKELIESVLPEKEKSVAMPTGCSVVHTDGVVFVAIVGFDSEVDFVCTGSTECGNPFFLVSKKKKGAAPTEVHFSKHRGYSIFCSKFNKKQVIVTLIAESAIRRFSS